MRFFHAKQKFERNRPMNKAFTERNDDLIEDKIERSDIAKYWRHMLLTLDVFKEQSRELRQLNI